MSATVLPGMMEQRDAATRGVNPRVVGAMAVATTAASNSAKRLAPLGVSIANHSLRQ
jgi:hypothetical protein